MKKLYLLLAILSTTAFAAGTVVYTRRDVSPKSNVVVLDWTGDASTGAVPTQVVSLIGEVEKVVTNPGTPAPTSNYDIALGDPDDSNLDLLAAAAQNRHTTTTEQVYPAIAGAPGTVTSRAPYAAGKYTFAVTGNTATAAKGKVFIYLRNQ